MSTWNDLKNRWKFKVKAMEKDAAVGKRFLVSSETGYTQVSWRNEIWVQMVCFHTGSRHCGREVLQVWCLQRYSLVALHHYHLFLPARCRWQRWSQTDIRCADCTVKNWTIVVTSMNSFSCVLFKLWTMNPNSGWLKCKQAEACNFCEAYPLPTESQEGKTGYKSFPQNVLSYSRAKVR